MNKFTDSEKKLSQSDIRRVEQELSIKLPLSICEHYLKYNGGKPSKSLWVDPAGKWDDIDVRYFMPLIYRADFADNPEFTANGIARELWQKKELPQNLFPFGIDWGGNFICIDHVTGEVYFYATDTWSDNRTIEQNFRTNSVLMSSSFLSYMDCLVESLEEDETVLSKTFFKSWYNKELQPDDKYSEKPWFTFVDDSVAAQLAAKKHPISKVESQFVTEYSLEDNCVITLRHAYSRPDGFGKEKYFVEISNNSGEKKFSSRDIYVWDEAINLASLLKELSFGAAVKVWKKKKI